MSNHLTDQWEAPPPSDYGTPAARMPTWARTLIALLVVLLLSAGYLWFFGFQTLILLEARYLTRKAPAVRLAPAQLTDLSISRSPGRKLSYFGYEFEVPWNDVDEAKSGLIPDTNKAMIFFRSGNSLSVWHGSPRAFLNQVLSNDKIDQNTLRRIVGDEALQSDHALYRTILQMTPEKMTPFEPQSDAANQALLLLVKGLCLPAGSESGVFAVSAGEFSGFQFGRPENPSGQVSVRLFSPTSSLNFIFVHTAGGPTVISQPDINRLLQTLH
ncbi:MAG TPA: hypothetical protein VE778_00945 [Candidatus Bathyarchaeia archaeon]|nr:hypothetical protein [Candidatus Bathyarchaeia archaeon]